jgi:hypothetical protein
MERQRFLDIAKDWDVEDTLHSRIVKDHGEQFVDVYRLDEADWEAVSLKLARDFNEVKQQLNLLQDSQITQVDDLKAEVDHQKGRVKGRDDLITEQRDSISRLSTENYEQFNRIEALLVVIQALGDRIHDLNEEAKK